MGVDKSNEDIRKLWRYMSDAKLNLMRNLSFGAAGILIANTLLLAQIGVRDLSLEISLFSSVIALPLWVAEASIWEAYIFHGQRALPHLRTDFTINTLMALFFLAGIGVVIAIGALVWHLSPPAALSFCGVCFASFVIMGIHDNRLKKHLQKTGP